MAKAELIEAALSGFPQQIKLESGLALELRPAEKEDKAAIVDFAKGLNEDDVLFLRVDITKPAVVSNWLKNVSKGEAVSLLAVIDERVVGYATVDRNPAKWTRRVGEIRVNISPQMRSQGLGRHLTAKIFDVARHMGLSKLVAHMTPDQTGAQAAFARLGFRPEALLADYIEDQSGRVHDLAILSYDIDGLNNMVGEPLQL